MKPIWRRFLRIHICNMPCSSLVHLGALVARAPLYTFANINAICQAPATPSSEVVTPLQVCFL